MENGPTLHGVRIVMKIYATKEGSTQQHNITQQILWGNKYALISAPRSQHFSNE